MSDTHKEKGELALLRKKNAKLLNENQVLLQKLKTYKEKELRQSDKESKKQEIFKKLKNFEEKTTNQKEDIIFVDELLEKDLNMDVFTHHVKNDFIFNKYAPRFLETHPLQIYTFLKTKNMSKITNHKLKAFYNRQIKPEIETEWDGWYQD
ncbi:hypothetical protein M153_4020006690 [Pseudoloma neurophilia]|uniref:Uncharacterized protein n=1 Tax=Pseudoloma neurophilia TaxID=146866 RepID=A0A0R0LXY1_9MICR|nr:hypothetical protein M153_4020006690 [Pseudoloma neurophilia]